MKHKDVEKLKPEQLVIHRRYGVCIVREVLMAKGELFGMVVRPANKNGRELLRRDSGCNIPDMLEDQTRNLSTENEPGEKPIDHLTAWGTPESDLPEQEQIDFFAPKGEQVPG